MKINRFVQFSVSFVERHFDGIINQSRNVKPLLVDTKFRYRPITEIATIFIKIVENRHIWPKWNKTLQNRETL